MKNLLLVEDDPEATRLLEIYLSSESYRLVCCGTGGEAISKLNVLTFDLIILDISLPDISGFEICKHLRDDGCTIPIIMLTSRSEETDKVLALDIGADDYVTKPFGTLEFMSRINALLRRSEQTRIEANDQNQEISYKELVINTNKRKVTLRGKRLELTHKEFDLLVLLATHPGRTFNRYEILELVWGNTFEGYANTISTHINRLRNKLEADISDPKYILTSWGAGYRFSE
ncbi:response regulator transcription factor [Segetibacter aerophilus]|nr:response regulator transcription factor [Segetibacter aerophilus]